MKPHARCPVRAVPALPVAACALLISLLFPASCGSAGEPADRASPELHRVLETYFRSWSAGDMVTYRSLFHDDATVVALAGGRVVYALEPDEFVRRQARSREAAMLTERMTSVETREDSMAATARVTWELTGGTQAIEGIDLFTLIRDSTGTWKITHLLFYQTK